jgi:hypothetical protein
LIVGCRTVIERRIAGGELRGGVFGFPSLAFGDGMEKQHRPGWHVGVGGCGAFPQVRAVLRTAGGLDADLFQQLPNKLATISPVIIKRVV